MFVVDFAHFNDFAEREMNTLVSKVANRGYTVELMERQGLLEEKLRRADSFAVILPRQPYTKAETAILGRFVDKGGRLLLIGDPGRRHDINSVAESFSILFQEGHLYNVPEHNLNYRNIFVRDFRPDELTEGLTEITLYTAGSIKSPGIPLAFTDRNTFSSVIEPFTPIVKSTDGQVLAISDITFLLPPQNISSDNDRFIAKIADFLTTADRGFDVSDFPHFFEEDVDILVGQPSLFDVGTRVKSLLTAFEIGSEIRGVENLSKDTVFLGLYDDAPAVAQYLDVAGVQVNDTLRTPFTPDIPVRGTAVVMLHQDRERQVLVVLGDNERVLQTMVSFLRSGVFREGLVSDFLGIYQVS